MAGEPPFAGETIAIVGVGLIGGSLGLALKGLDIGRRVVGVSRQETLDEAFALDVIDAGYRYEDLESGIRDAALVFLCTPIVRILDLLPEVLAAARQDAVVTDVGSTKHAIVSSATAHRRDGVHFVGGHPMAGSEQRGVSAADPFLFQNAIYILTPSPETPDFAVEGLACLVSAFGARPMRMTPQEHDRAAAAVSHLPQMMATSLVSMIGRMTEDEGLPIRMAAGGFRDLTRIASSPYEMWRDICHTNATPIREMIDLYIESLSAIRSAVDRDRLEQAFDFANRIRGQIPKDSKGFLHPLHEILLLAEDRPGVIADVARTLAGENININDIEVLSVREGEGGTIRMGFDSRPCAELAVDVLGKAGYSVRMR
ncbi:MAG: prephenate dehydrogenase [Gemmatimonadota bacterium]|nr:prephenate dehydrogenase [Gemmatimonadota bacterium]